MVVVVVCMCVLRRESHVYLVHCERCVSVLFVDDFATLEHARCHECLSGIVAVCSFDAYQLRWSSFLDVSSSSVCA